MGISILSTPIAIMQYVSKVRGAHEKLEEATERMNKAAQELVEKWQGDAAQAFAQEQKVLYDYCKQLTTISTEYQETATRQADNYRDMEQQANSAITAK